MASTILTTIGANGLPIHKSPTSTIPYGELALFEETFGRIILPSVYGKDLDRFEVASSGSIVLTLNDQFAVELTEYDKVVYVQPADSNSINMSLANDGAKLAMNYDAQTVELTAGHDVYVTGNDFIKLNTADDLATLSMDTSNVIMKSSGTLAITSENQNAYLNIDTSSNNVNIYSSNDCTIHSSHEVIIQAKALRIYVDEFDLSYSFAPTSTGALNLTQTVIDPATGEATSIQIAKFGIPVIL